MLVIYKESTGEITQVKPDPPTGEIPEGLAPEGSLAILTESPVSGKTHRVEHGVIVDIPQSEQEQEEISWAWDDLRARRGSLLAKSDWTQVPDAPVEQAAWATYRQELRDLPANTDDPREVVWPQQPSEA